MGGWFVGGVGEEEERRAEPWIGIGQKPGICGHGVGDYYYGKSNINVTEQHTWWPRQEQRGGSGSGMAARRMVLYWYDTVRVRPRAAVGNDGCRGEAGGYLAYFIFYLE